MDACNLANFTIPDKPCTIVDGCLLLSLTFAVDQDCYCCC